jgi:hypothetical protein
VAGWPAVRRTRASLWADYDAGHSPFIFWPIHTGHVRHVRREVPGVVDRAVAQPRGVAQPRAEPRVPGPARLVQRGVPLIVPRREVEAAGEEPAREIQGLGARRAERNLPGPWL